eukprot:4012576-Pyramimonas_sp.AAC.1
MGVLGQWYGCAMRVLGLWYGCAMGVLGLGSMSARWVYWGSVVWVRDGCTRAHVVWGGMRARWVYWGFGTAGANPHLISPLALAAQGEVPVLSHGGARGSGGRQSS